MSILTDAGRTAIWKDFGEEISRARDGVGITKAQLKAAVDAIDSWIDANALSMNSAIPQPARGALSASQKARILALVVHRRYGDGA